jgi:hypothetical protein
MTISRRREGRTVTFTPCIVKPYGILKIRITLVKTVYYTTEYTCSPFCLMRSPHCLFYKISLSKRITRFIDRLLSNTHQPIKICQSKNVGLSRARVKFLKYASMDPCHFALMASEVSTYMHYFSQCVPQLTKYILCRNFLPFREA